MDDDKNRLHYPDLIRTVVMPFEWVTKLFFPPSNPHQIMQMINLFDLFPTRARPIDRYVIEQSQKHTRTHTQII